MPAAFQYRPKFVDIRVRPPPPADATPATEDVRACDHAGCRAAGVARAPKHPRGLDQASATDHYWFCQAHAAEYNRSWNFFAGLSETEARARMEADLATGGRPTWTLHSGGRNREAASLRGRFHDPHGLFAGAFAREPPREDPRLGKLERTALTDLDLAPGASGAAIRARYIDLVKRCHPDANGGDRSAEHKLQRVLRAYKTLRKAKLA